jgi:hypothetical protein
VAASATTPRDHHPARAQLSVYGSVLPFPCNGLYTALNGSALIAKLLGFSATAVQKAAMAAASKAAAGIARDARTLASSFKAASTDQKMVDATRLFEVASTKKVTVPTVAVSLVVPDYWDSQDTALTGTR